MSMPNLYIGPLGQAQIRSINFRNSILKAEAIMGVLNKIKSLELILESKSTPDFEKKITAKLIDELLQCLLDIDGAHDDQGRNRKVPKIFN